MVQFQVESTPVQVQTLHRMTTNTWTHAAPSDMPLPSQPYHKAGLVPVWLAGKTVWSHCYTWAISERFRYKVLYKFILLYFFYFTRGGIHLVHVEKHNWLLFVKCWVSLLDNFFQSISQAELHMWHKNNHLFIPQHLKNSLSHQQLSATWFTWQCR